MKNILNKREKVASFSGLFLIGSVCFFYSILGSTFAEIHTTFSFLPFPVFIGEWLIFLCFSLSLVCLKTLSFKAIQWVLLIIGYFLIIFLKTIVGYENYGPLALRHSALFYYPSFIMFSFLFFKTNVLNKITITLGFCLIGVSFIFFSGGTYFVLTYVLMACVLLQTIKGKMKWFLILLVVLSIPYSLFFHTARMMMVANAVALVFMFLLLTSFLNMKRGVKVVLQLLFCGLLMGGIYWFSDMNALKSIVNINDLVDLYKEKDEIINQKINSFEFKEVNAVQLFNPNCTKIKGVEALKEKKVQLVDEGKDERPERFMGENTKSVGALDDRPEVFIDDGFIESNSDIEGGKKSLFYKKKYSEKNSRPYQVACNNVIFRIFIWRDMMREFVKEKPIFGFSFGKPLRSRSLEILNWGATEWQRDGWIGAHNSWLHIIYRAGIVGLVFIILIFWLLIKMIIFYLKQKSFIGICLSAIAVNWFVAANFLLILELPYTAIPIWSLFGLNYAYYRQLKDKKMGVVDAK